MQDGTETAPESPEPQPKTQVNWNAFAWVAVGFVTIILGFFFFLAFVVPRLFPW